MRAVAAAGRIPRKAQVKAVPAAAATAVLMSLPQDKAGLRTWAVAAAEARQMRWGP
jgi:hypothetical protein